MLKSPLLGRGRAAVGRAREVVGIERVVGGAL